MQTFIIGRRVSQPHFGTRMFWTVCYTDHEGKLWNRLDPMDYPFHWGFGCMDHAQKVADNFNDESSDGGSATMARRFAEIERAA